jgi:hypothetical protein
MISTKYQHIISHLINILSLQKDMHKRMKQHIHNVKNILAILSNK